MASSRLRPNFAAERAIKCQKVPNRGADDRLPIARLAQNSLASLRDRSDGCRDRGNRPQKEIAYDYVHHRA